MQVSQQAQHQADGRFAPGASGNPLGRESRAAKLARRDARAAELAAEFGGLDALTAVERVMIQQAAELLLGNPRSAEDKVRYANTIARLLGAVRKRRGEREPHVPLRERLAAESVR